MSQHESDFIAELQTLVETLNGYKSVHWARLREQDGKYELVLDAIRLPGEVRELLTLRQLSFRTIRRSEQYHDSVYMALTVPDHAL